jgi:folate-binding protein YgfZ
MPDNQASTEASSEELSEASRRSLLQADYGALRSSAGVRLCTERAVIRMSGDDRVSFLHGMCSNDIKGLELRSLAPALFLTERAHLIADANVWAAQDALMLETERTLWPAIRAQLERFLVADDVELEESGEAVRYDSVIQIDGPKAADAISAAFGQHLALTGAWRFIEAENGAVLVAQVTRWGAPAYTLLAGRGAAPEIVNRVVARAAGSGIREVGADAAQVLRVESGTARAGIDTNEKTIALEARMEPAISFCKGCYVGQETVERATARGAIKRRLMGLRIEGDRVPASGAAVILDGKEVGAVTSPVFSPRYGVLALALLHHSAWPDGTRVIIQEPASAIGASVSELPFSDGACGGINAAGD